MTTRLLTGSTVQNDDDLSKLRNVDTRASINSTAISKSKLVFSKRSVMSARNNKNLLLLAYVIMILSAILFSILAVLIQYGSNFGYPSGELLMFRGIEQILIIIITVTIYKEYATIRDNCKKLNKYSIMWLILRGFSGSCAGLSYFLAISVLPLGDAIAVFSIYPLTCCVFGWILLKEEITWIHFALIISSSCGVMLVAQPTFLSFMFKGTFSDNDRVDSHLYVIPIIGAFWAGIAFVSMRKSKGTHIKLLVLSYSIFSCVAGILSTIIYHYLHAFENHVLFKFVGFNGWNEIKQWLVLLGMGIVGYFAQTTMTFSAQKLQAGLSSFIRSSDIIWSYIFGVLFFHQIPSLVTITGALLIFASIMGVCVLKYLKTKQRMKDLNK
eukprot:403385_1